MTVNVNLFHDINARELVIDYNLTNPILQHNMEPLVFRIERTQATEFIDLVYEKYPTFKDHKFFPVTTKEIINLYAEKYFKVRIKKIKPPFPFITVVAEQIIGNVIMANSRLFCGSCGNIIATVKQRLEFPYSSQVFLDSLDDVMIEERVFTDAYGEYYILTCKHCLVPIHHPGYPVMFDSVHTYFHDAKKLIQKGKI